VTIPVAPSTIAIASPTANPADTHDRPTSRSRLQVAPC
jgi:hypothetical protein